MSRYTALIAGICLLAVSTQGRAQGSPESAYSRLLQLTSLFHGAKPFACNAIVELKYKSSAGKPIRDTSRLIYRDGKTYYKSRRVEHINGAEGDLTVNHELRTISFQVSDSIRQVFQESRNLKPDPELESLIDKDATGTEMQSFRKFLVTQCQVKWEKKGTLEEIQFLPKAPDQASLLSVTIRFEGDQVRYYEYTSRDLYAKDYYGRSQFRIIKTLYENFQHEAVPALPLQLADLIQWNGWTLRMTKYPNYKLIVL